MSEPLIQLTLTKSDHAALQQALRTLSGVFARAEAAEIIAPIPESHDPVCPGTGGQHVWGRYDRYTDQCVMCPAAKPHQGRR